MKKIIFAFAIALIAIGCFNKKQAAVEGNTSAEADDKKPSLQYVDLSKGNIRYSGLSDAFEVKSIEQKKGIIHLTVSYGGGCEPHSFDVTWDGIKDDNMVNLTVYHHGNNDMCKALLQPTIQIDPTEFFGKKSDHYSISIVNGATKESYQVK